MQIRSWRMLAFGFGIAAAAIAAIGAAVVVTGVYNVGASAEHLYITDRLITFALHRSIAVRTYGIDVPDLEDDDLIQLGAEHFRTGCAPCHAAPGMRQNPIVSRMYPAPPALREAVEDWTAAELFWIVKHGIKFTGMPMWPGEDRDDEVWAIVAFLQKLGEMEGEVPRGDDGEPLATDLDFAVAGDASVEVCARCHGDEETPPISGLVPALHGQSARYLTRALTEYRGGVRESGVMEPLAAELASDEIGDLARYYAALERRPREGGIPAGDVARGREIAQNGIAEEGIPPCLVCHSGRASPQFPILGGLSANYLKGQLDLWRKGLRSESAYGAIMATIATRLTPQQIDDVAAYFAGVPQGDHEDLSADARERPSDE